MNRRQFLEALGIVGGVALAEAVIPFNRVWSFPSKIVIAQPRTLLNSSIAWEWDDYEAAVKAERSLPRVIRIVPPGWSIPVEYTLMGG